MKSDPSDPRNRTNAIGSMKSDPWNPHCRFHILETAAITFLYVVIVLVVVFLTHRGDAMHSHV